MQPTNDMDLATFEEALDRHGANLEHWPAETRVIAEALLARSNEAQALLSEALEFHSLLDAVPPVEASAALRRRLAEIPLRHPRRDAAWQWPFESVWRPLAGLALAATLGVVVGGVTPLDVGGTASTETDAWDDVATMILGADLDTLEEGEET